MVVDDDSDTREILRLVFEQAGAVVISADSVNAVFETYRRSPPHGVVADIQLGSSDGYALIKRIRENDLEYRGRTAVVAVTGYDSPDIRNRALAAGFDAYITKPFDPAVVVATMTRLLVPANAA